MSGLSTELEVVPPRASRSALIAVTAVLKVIAAPLFRYNPVSLDAICAQQA